MFSRDVLIGSLNLTYFYFLFVHVLVLKSLAFENNQVGHSFSSFSRTREKDVHVKKKKAFVKEDVNEKQKKEFLKKKFLRLPLF